MRRIGLLLLVILSLPKIGQAQFDTLYMDLVPDANEVLPMVMVQGDEYWCFGKAINTEGDHFRIKKVNGQGEVLEVLDSTAYAPYIYIFGAGTISTSDNGILLASETAGSIPNTVKGKTIKFNNDLSIDWVNIEESIYTDSTDFALDFAAEISDKAFIVSGWYRQMEDGDFLDALYGQVIMKLDSLGNTIWVRTELQPEGTPYGIYSNEIIELGNGEFIHLRWFHSPVHYLSRLELQRLAANGDVIEGHMWDDNYHYGQPAAIVKDGFLYMIYGTHEDEVSLFDPIQTDVRFKKFNLETWQEVWDVSMNIDALDDISWYTYMQDFEELDNGELVAFCYGAGFYEPNISFLVNFNLDGSINWQKEYALPPAMDNDYGDALMDMIVCPDGGYMMTGYVEHYLEQRQHHHLIKTDACGDVVFSGCGVGVNEWFKTATSIAIYPNPAASQLTLSLTNNSNATTISIFDLQGQLLLYESTRPYQDNKTLDISALPSGIYMLQVTDELGNQNTVKWAKE